MMDTAEDIVVDIVEDTMEDTAEDTMFIIVGDTAGVYTTVDTVMVGEIVQKNIGNSAII